MPPALYSFPWFESKDEFEAVMAIIPSDEAKAFGTYVEWMIDSKKREEMYSQKGYGTYRVAIKASIIVEHAYATDVKPSRASIADYAQHKMLRDVESRRPR